MRSSRSKGGYVTSQGYREIYVNGKRRLEHRFVLEQRLGRRLGFHEHVHHINHNKLDNRLRNLRIFSSAEHTLHHNPRIVLASRKCLTCQSVIEYPSNRNTKYCSRKCFAKHCSQKARVRLICPVCKKAFTRKRFQAYATRKWSSALQKSVNVRSSSKTNLCSIRCRCCWLSQAHFKH